MRAHVRPRGSPVGVSTGPIGTLLLLSGYLLVLPLIVVFRTFPQLVAATRWPPAVKIGVVLGVWAALIILGATVR